LRILRASKPSCVTELTDYVAHFVPEGKTHVCGTGL
jgi:hypothetical protein